MGRELRGHGSVRLNALHIPINSRSPLSGHELRLAARRREQRRHQLRLSPGKLALLEIFNNFNWSLHEHAGGRQLQSWSDLTAEDDREPMDVASEETKSRFSACAIQQRYLRRLTRLPKHRLDRLAETSGWHWL